MNFDNNIKPISLQIIDFISENILKKRWHEEERVPSVRELAVTLEVNPNTVLKAYVYLEENNIFFKKRGIGYFISNGGYNKMLDLKKDDFIKNEIPILLQNMNLLNLTIKELTEILTSSNPDLNIKN